MTPMSRIQTTLPANGARERMLSVLAVRFAFRFADAGAWAIVDI